MIYVLNILTCAVVITAEEIFYMKDIRSVFPTSVFPSGCYATITGFFVKNSPGLSPFPCLATLLVHKAINNMPLNNWIYSYKIVEINERFHYFSGVNLKNREGWTLSLVNL
jgi:hypothetical protein